jgi:hypothetical protein
MRFPIQLNTDQSRRLQETFSVIYPDANSFGDGLRAIEKRYSLLETANLTYFQNLAGILQTAAAEGWLMPLVDFTLRKVQDPDLEALRKDLLPRARAVGVDPFLVCRLSGSNIMLDRRDLRSYLRSLSNPYGKRLLVVKGSRKTGKTHTCQLISYLQQCVGGFAFRRIDLELFTRMGGLAVQSASTTAPIQIVTAKPHGFTSGNSVYIDGVTGLHGANGLWIITVTEASEFLLNGSQGKGVYVGGGIAKLQTPVEAWQIAEVLTDMLPYEVELPDAPTDAQWARWVNKFCNKLEKAIVALPPREQQLWIVIDSFHSVLLGTVVGGSDSGNGQPDQPDAAAFADDSFGFRRFSARGRSEPLGGGNNRDSNGR